MQFAPLEPFIFLIFRKNRLVVKSLERWPRRANLGRPVHAVNPVEKLVDNDLRTRLWIQDLLKVPPRCFYELLLLSADLDPVEYRQARVRDVQKILGNAARVAQALDPIVARRLPASHNFY